MQRKQLIPPKRGRREFGGGQNLHLGIAEVERRLGCVEVEMLRLVEMFGDEFPVKGPGGLFLRVLWISREGRAVPDMLVWRTLTRGIGHQKRWGKDVGMKLTKSLIYQAGLYSQRQRVFWYSREIDRLRRERKKLVGVWDRIRKIVLPYLKIRG